MKEIFVLIPAYRDPEILRTVQDLFSTARHPERVRAGICWQNFLDSREDRLEFTGFEDHIRTVNCDARESQGMGWARNQAWQLYRDEDYVLCIDSHSQFLKHWDDLLIGQLEACPGDKAVLSGVPHAYQTSGGSLEEAPAAFRYPSHFEDNGLLRLSSAQFNRPPEAPVAAPFLVTRFMFSRADFLREVPPDPWSYFTEEEITLSLRAWSHGWDVFHPDRVGLWHLYNTDGHQRPLHWKEHPKWRDFLQRSIACYQAMLNSDNGPFGGRRRRYRCGTARDLGDFAAWAGVDFGAARVLASPGRGSFAEQVAAWSPAALELWRKAAASPRARGAGQPILQASPATHQRLVPNVGRHLEQAPVNPLEIGDQVPCFTLPDIGGRDCHVEIYAGRHLLLHVVTDPASGLASGFGELREMNPPGQAGEMSRLAIFPGGIESFGASGWSALQARWCLDAEGWLGEVLQAQRIDADGHGMTTFLLDPNLRILRAIASPDPAAHLQLGAPKAEDAPLEYLHGHPPVMVLPDVLGADLVSRLVAYWESGEHFKGGVGAGDASRVKYDVKRRTDVMVRDPDLLREIDQAFARNLFPELRKLTGYDLRYRERYKVGCYLAEDSGVFNKHRDTGDVPLSFRRYAVSLFLNDDYAGGGLVFPEYGRFAYTASPGSAVVFPAPVMHEVQPVTRGRRLVLITFLFDENQAAFRSCYRQYHGEPDDTPVYRTTVENHFRGLTTRSILTRALPLESIDRQDFTRHLDERPPELLLRPRRLDAPTGVLVVANHLDPDTCRRWHDHAEARSGTNLQVVDFEKSDAHHTVSMRSSGRITERLPLDGISREVTDEFARIYGSVLAAFYKVDFEWFEAPQLLRYNPGGIYKRHADADHWVREEGKWVRSHDRDFSVLVYLNDDFEGGELHFPRLEFRLRPRAGMLVAFPSTYRYEHAAEETTSGKRYALVSWAAILGSQRVKARAPFGSILLNRPEPES